MIGVVSCAQLLPIGPVGNVRSTYFSWVLAKNPYNTRAYLLYVWNEWKVGHLAGKVVLKGTDVEGFVDLAVAAFSHLGHGEW